MSNTRIELISAETPAHFQTAANILRTASQWMIEHNVSNWNPDQFDPAKMQQQTLAKVYLALQAGAVVGTTQTQRTDPLVWPEILTNDTIFVHKLAVLPKMAGQRIAYKILDEVCAIGRQSGLKWLRLDCRADRPKLREYYKGYGLQFVDIFEIVERNLVYARFELKLAA